MHVSMKSERIFPPSDVIIHVSFLIICCSLSFRRCKSPWSTEPPALAIDDLLIQDPALNVLSFFAFFSKCINKMTVTVKDAAETSTRVTSAALKKSEITSKEE